MEKVVEPLSLFRPFPLARRGRSARALTGTGRPSTGRFMSVAHSHGSMQLIPGRHALILSDQPFRW
jgi:hypothetical protein